MEYTKVQTFIKLMDDLEVYSKMYQLEMGKELVSSDQVAYYFDKIDEARSSLFNLAFKQED